MWIDNQLTKTQAKNAKKQDNTGVKAMVNITFILQVILLLVSPVPFAKDCIEDSNNKCSFFTAVSKRRTVIGPASDNDTPQTEFRSDWLYAIMFLRIIFVFKTYFNYSGYKTQFVKQVCSENGFYPGNWFILKLRLVRYPIQTVLALFFVSVAVFTNLIIVFELENFMPSATEAMKSPFWTAVYFSFITFSTIGY